MKLTIDASIAIKWVIAEERSSDALALRRGHALIAPDLLVSECASVLWKKVQRGQLTTDEAILTARLLTGAGIELLPARALLEAATRMALDLNHAAYDCIYLALALANNCRFVTADAGFFQKVKNSGRPTWADSVHRLGDGIPPT